MRRQLVCYPTRWIVRHSYALLLAAIGVGVALAFFSKPLTFDRDLTNMLPPGHPVRADQQRFVERFSASAVVLACYVDPDLFATDGSGLTRMGRVAGQLAATRGVSETFSLVDFDEALGRFDLASTFNPQATRPLLRENSTMAARVLALSEGLTHGRDRETAAIVCLLEPEETADVPHGQTIAALRQIMSSLPAPLNSGIVAGEPVMVSDGFQLVRNDGRWLTWASIALMAVVLLLSFRSVRWTLVPLAVVLLAWQLTRSAIFVMGMEMTLIAATLASVITAISIAATVHFIVRWREFRAGGLDAANVLRSTLEVTAVPILWAAVTDAVAFAALTASSVGPVRDYGLIMAVGALLVPVSIFLLVPGLSRIGLRQGKAVPAAQQSDTLDRALQSSVGRLVRYPRQIAIVWLLCGAAIAVGVCFLRVETDFTRNFRRDSTLVQSYEFIEQRLGGAGAWDVMVPAPPRLTPDFVSRIERLERRIRELQVDGEPVVTSTLSLVDAVQLFGDVGPPAMRAQLLRAGMPEFYSSLWSCDADGQCWLRIMLRSRERQDAGAKKQAIEGVTSLVRQEFPGTDEQPAAAAAGLFVLLTTLIEGTIQDQWRCFGLAVLGVFVALLCAVRDWRLAVVALVVNLVPVLMVLGVVGWIGQPVNLGVAMIAAVSIGIAVDGSLHYLADYQRCRRDGKSVDEAVTHAETVIGRAVVFSTIALALGFCSLATSQFIPTVTFGLLTALAMLGSLVGNLVLLPALLLLVDSRA